ncbi:MAG TPA: DUF4173 domain-containing protein [Gaiellaceae bacterium]|nr:DUF4173 domain-containing protein [Gaiellaceae bacterium]
MSERTRLGLAVLGAALALGVLGDLLLRETPWGLNWALWAFAFTAAAWLAGARRPLLLLALAYSALLLWRASPMLATLNLAASASALALATAPLRAGIASYAAAALRLAWNTGAGAVLVPAEVDWSDTPRGRWTGHAAAAARGLAIAVPLVLVFGGLFVAADAVFENLVRDTLEIGNPMTHFGVIVLWAWLACGFLRHALRPQEPVAAEARRRLGRVETAVVLGCLDVLFLVFVLVQLRYLFGGQEHVVETTGLTYAEYARRGFFELVAVAALVVPLVLAADALVRDEARRLFRVLSLALLALLAVVMSSALERMRLYTAEYGLTELRLYVTAFMAWLGLALTWSLLSVFRDRRHDFMPGAATAGFAVVLALNVLNPDAVIVRTNLDRHFERGRTLDVSYLTRLSADGAPELASRVDRLQGLDRRLAVEWLDQLDRPRDRRTWNWGRWRAADYVRRARAAYR